MAAAVVAGCSGEENTSSNVSTPGSDVSAKTKALEAGAAILQDKPPIEALNAYLDGFHFYSGRQEAQMEAHHYCSILNEDVIQCVIYDGNLKNAKLMGVEYIVSEKIFHNLPNAEKALWHSHAHEVKSGQLIAPGIPEVAEKELMKKLVSTYGKTWHTWHTDMQKQLPLGVPQLMMGFTADGQIDPSMVAARDARFGVSSSENRRTRADIPVPNIDVDANGGQGKRPFQIADTISGTHDHGVTKGGAKTVSPGTNARSGKP